MSSKEEKDEYRYIDMGSTILPKAAVVEAITANLEQHKADFAEAMSAYEVVAVEKLQEHIERIRSGKPEEVNVRMPLPVSYEQEYIKALKMLELDLRDTVVLESDQFSAYVLDDWAWKRQFLFSNQTYTSAAGASR